MKKLFFILTLSLTLFGCQYDDLWIKDEFNKIDERLTKLETLCQNLNSDIKSMYDIIDAIKANEFVEDITPITEGDQTIGYKIVFESGKEISIFNGTDGQDGQDGYIPAISVKQDTDGEWYWTIDGEWMLDSEGNKISTTGRTDLVPMLKIDNYYWYISYDGGQTWSKLDKAVGKDGKSYFKEIKHDDEYVYLTLADGSVLTLSKASPFTLEMNISGEIACLPYQTITIPYILNGAGDDAEIFTITEGAWYAEVIPSSETEGKIVITAPEDVTKGQVIVFASNQNRSIVKSLTFVEGVFTAKDSFLLSDESGELTVSLSTNYNYEISIDATWIKYVETKAVRNENVIFSYDALPVGTTTRTAKITFTDEIGGFSRKIDVVQGNPLSLDRQSMTMIKNEEAYLTASDLSFSPELVWTSSDSDIVWVSQEGKVIAISEGTATITVMTADYEHSASCVVEVINLDDYIYLEYGSATNVSYSNGYVHSGTKLTWYFYNNSKEVVYVKYLQLVDAYGDEGNKMWIEENVYAGNYTGWVITLGSSIKGPRLKIVYEFNGKEYSYTCGHMFN